MKIVFINKKAGTKFGDSETKTFYIAKELVKLGHEVSIVSSIENSVSSDIINTKQMLCEEKISDVRFIYIRNSFIKRFSNSEIKSFFFGVMCGRLSKKIAAITNPNIVIYASPILDCYDMATKIAHYSKEEDVRVCYELRSFYSEKKKKTYLERLISIKKENRKKEYDAIECSDILFSPFYYADKYLEENNYFYTNIHYLPYGLSAGALPDNNADENFVRLTANLRKQNKRVLVYFGSLVNERVEKIIACADYLNKNIHIVLCSEQKAKSDVYERLKEKNNISVFDSIENSQFYAILSYSDVLLLGCNDNIYSKYGVTNCESRLYDYMYAQKPMIFLANALHDVMKKAKCGVTIASSNGEEIADSINAFCSLPQEELDFMGRRAYEYASLYHDYKRIAVKLEIIIGEYSIDEKEYGVIASEAV